MMPVLVLPPVAMAAALQTSEGLSGAVNSWSLGWGWELLGVALGLVVAALLVRRFAPLQRHKLRRTLYPLLFWLLVLLVETALSAAHLEARARAAAYLAILLQRITIINLSGLILFDLVLPAMRLRLADIVGDLAMGFAYLIAGLLALRESGVNLSSLIATSAVVTGVIGLSLQATLGNILGGVALQLDDSVHIGDWVQLESGRQGQITEIHWRHTVVETRDWDTIIVPNSALLAQDIILLGKRKGETARHRMWVYFNVDFRYSSAEVIEVVNAALQATPLANVATDPAPHCICYDFAKDTRDSFAYYAVRYWLTDLAKDDPTSSLVRLRIQAALRRAGIPLAVPAAAVFLSKDSPGHARRKEARELERRITILDRVELFDAMTPEEKAGLAPRIRPAPFTKGEVITRQGATAHWLYVLIKGEVEVRLRSDAGEERVLSTIQAPGFFGEMGMMTGAKRTSTIVALSEVECFRIDKEDFQHIITERPEIARGISVILAQRRIGLLAGKENLDAEERNRRIEAEHGRILAGIRTFFGLDTEA
jgi:small-conductance mechanosensitive channel/CRP-like cAMP-binding protein